MQHQNDLAKNLQNLFKESAYTPFGTGEFVNHPNMTGYYFIFKNITKPKFCIILNTSEERYPSDFSKVQDYVFIVLSIRDIKEYLANFAATYLPIILTKLDENLSRKNPRGLPYGYYLDENGNMRIDLRKKDEVNKIYDRYIETNSVRQIAGEMDSNFSHIRQVLANSAQYMEMTQKIVPMSKLKEVADLMATNVKGAFKKHTIEDELRERRQKIKQQRKMQALQQ